MGPKKVAENSTDNSELLNEEELCHHLHALHIVKFKVRRKY